MRNLRVLAAVAGVCVGVTVNLACTRDATGQDQATADPASSSVSSGSSNPESTSQAPSAWVEGDRIYINLTSSHSWEGRGSNEWGLNLSRALQSRGLTVLAIGGSGTTVTVVVEGSEADLAEAIETTDKAIGGEGIGVELSRP